MRDRLRHRPPEPAAPGDDRSVAAIQLHRPFSVSATWRTSPPPDLLLPYGLCPSGCVGPPTLLLPGGRIIPISHGYAREKDGAGRNKCTKRRLVRRGGLESPAGSASDPIHYPELTSLASQPSAAFLLLWPSNERPDDITHYRPPLPPGHQMRRRIPHRWLKLPRSRVEPHPYNSTVLPRLL